MAEGFHKLSVSSNNTRLNPIARVILQGVYDDNSPLSMLIGIPHVLQMIWGNVTAYWKRYIKLSNPELRASLHKRERLHWEEHEDPPEDLPFYAKITQEAFQNYKCEFPKPTDLNINMMPFVMEKSFAKCKLPLYLRPYWKLIKCCNLPAHELGAIGYLTIHESFVGKDTSQRRPGIHTETPGKVILNTNPDGLDVAKGGGEAQFGDMLFLWGRGHWSGSMNQLEGGIYMASNVDNSCEVWDCQILQDDLGQDIIGELGDIEHLRSFLPPDREIMEKNVMYWLTDRTPHESLPLKKGTCRQYFRLVTREVSIWYKDHSTPNPLGVVPDSDVTLTVKGSKFDRTGVVII